MNALVWFRRDLRLRENPAFLKACAHESVLLLYIFEEDEAPGSAQEWWLDQSLRALACQLRERNLFLTLEKGQAHNVLLPLIKTHAITHVYWNDRYDGKGRLCDQKIAQSLRQKGIQVVITKGNGLHEPWKIQTQQATPFKVYRAFFNEINRLESVGYEEKTCHQPHCLGQEFHGGMAHQKQDFSAYWTPGERSAQEKWQVFLDHDSAGYKEKRDFPWRHGTSRLSPHLHFGEISVGQMWREVAKVLSEKPWMSTSLEPFKSELGWREFSYYSLYHDASIASENTLKKFDRFVWNDPVHLKAWQQGKTGFPMVDAGMRELLATGFMHNRLRMIVASFLTKNLGIDWRLGAQWFLDRLLDGDLAVNSVNWQWVAGTGFDSCPYFRIFNPTLQGQKFDPQGDYIRRWVPELASIKTDSLHDPEEALRGRVNYPPPIVSYAQTRKAALAAYQALI